MKNLADREWAHIGMVLKGKKTRFGWDYNSHSLYVNNNEEVQNLSTELAERFWDHLIIMHIQTICKTFHLLVSFHF